MKSNSNFVKYVENKVKQTIKKYDLFKPKDKIIVAVSGGKDSTALLYILNKLGYKIEALTVDVAIGNYTKKNVGNIKQFCNELNIKIHIVEFKKEFGHTLCYLRSVINSKLKKPITSCTVCGVLRRYLLNKHVRKLKATKVVTGHNADDEAQAILMNLFKNNLELSSRLGPSPGLVKIKSFVPRVKPLYFLLDKEVERYSKIMNFPVKYGHCPCSTFVFRRAVKEQLYNLESKKPGISLNIINNFLKKLPKIKKAYSTSEKPLSCKICSEPSKKEICQTCKLLSILR